MGNLNLTGAEIDSFRSAILIPNLNPSRSEPNNFSFNSLISFRSPIWTYNYPLQIVRVAVEPRLKNIAVGRCVMMMMMMTTTMRV